jgi:cyclophilin family peptidyl-prolyl cis-trans isomerase
MRELSWFPFVFALGACSSGAQPSTDAGNGNDATPVDGGGDASDGEAGSGEYCPAGYTLTPFLTATATTHTFTQATQVADPNKDYMAVLETDAGRIVWHFHQSTAPLATNSFIFLALNHFFDGIAFHRVITGVIAQGGDPNTLQTNRSTWGGGGPGYEFADELTPSPVYSALTVAMANSGPNTNGSQFFINMTDNSQTFSPDYTLFADIVDGSATLPNIATSPDANGFTPPTTPTRMTDVHICEQ